MGILTNYLEKIQNALDKEYEAQKENLENTKQMVQDKKDVFDKEYEFIILSLASQAAIAISNMRYTEELKAVIKNVKNHLRINDWVQLCTGLFFHVIYYV